MLVNSHKAVHWCFNLHSHSGNKLPKPKAKILDDNFLSILSHSDIQADVEPNLNP